MVARVLGRSHVVTLLSTPTSAAVLLTPLLSTLCPTLRLAPSLLAIATVPAAAAAEALRDIPAHWYTVLRRGRHLKARPYPRLLM